MSRRYVRNYNLCIESIDLKRRAMNCLRKRCIFESAQATALSAQKQT